MPRTRRWTFGIAAALAVALAGGWAVRAALADAFRPGPSAGPSAADGRCPTFAPAYPRCEVRFGNRGLSTLNSVYETFAGEGAFEIRGFRVATLGAGRFDIVADSNRGPLRSEVHADRIVRLGQEREDERVNRTHQSAFCDAGRVYEHQVGYADGEPYVQDLEFWTEGDALRFRLFQDGRATADVVCRAE